METLVSKVHCSNRQKDAGDIRFGDDDELRKVSFHLVHTIKRDEHAFSLNLPLDGAFMAAKVKALLKSTASLS